MQISLRKKILIFLTLIITCVAIIATVVVAMPQSFAVWTGSGGEDSISNSINTNNESAWGKYFIYSPCTVTIGNVETSGYEIVGIKDGFLNSEMVIPRTVPEGATILGAKLKDNNKVIKISNQLNSDFKLNYILSKLVIFENILEIDPYTFSMLDQLTTLELINKDTQAHSIKIGEYAFAFCSSLSVIRKSSNFEVVGTNITTGNDTNGHFDKAQVI